MRPQNYGHHQQTHRFGIFEHIQQREKLLCKKALILKKQ
jgi:hypothetical protein